MSEITTLELNITSLGRCGAWQCCHGACVGRVAIGVACQPSSPLQHSKKCPEAQICPKFVPTIVLRGSNRGDPNLLRISRIYLKFASTWGTQICHKFVKNLEGKKKHSFEASFPNIRLICNKFGSPRLEPRKTIVVTNFGQIWGLGHFFECCKGPEGTQVKKSCSLYDCGAHCMIAPGIDEH